MTTDKHAAEPWSVVRDRDGSTGWRGIGIKTGTGFVANMVMRPGDENEIDNARRIVACVNALAGISTEALEDAVTVAPLHRFGHLRDLMALHHVKAKDCA